MWNRCSVKVVFLLFLLLLKVSQFPHFFLHETFTHDSSYCGLVFYELEHSWALIHSVERYHTGLCASSVSPGPVLLFQMGLPICVLDCFWISHNFQGNVEFIKIVAILLTNGAPPRTQIATVCSSLYLVIRLFLMVTSRCRTFVSVFGDRVFLHTTQAGLKLTVYPDAANRSLINLGSQELAPPE